MDEQRERATQFMQVEDLRDLCNQVQVDPVAWEKSKDTKSSNKPLATQAPNRPKGPRCNNYTPFIFPRAKILQEVFSPTYYHPQRRNYPSQCRWTQALPIPS